MKTLVAGGVGIVLGMLLGMGTVTFLTRDRFAVTFAGDPTPLSQWACYIPEYGNGLLCADLMTVLNNIIQDNSENL